MRKFDDWLRRSIEPVDGMPLGAPLELWRVVPKHPANDWLRDKAKQLGRNYSDSNLTYDTSRSHLLDVLYAGAAIEYTVGRIDAICSAVQAYAEEQEVKAQAEDVPMGLRTTEVDEAYWEYANLLTWMRTLLDRMRSTDPHSRVTLGLIPAPSEHTPFRRSVETVFDRLTRDSLIEDEVHLTNYGLHLHSLPGGGTPVARVTTGGRVCLLIPDKPGQRVYVFDQFTYDDERELVPFAHAVLDRVERFVDEL
jgi:hypothetical protein